MKTMVRFWIYLALMCLSLTWTSCSEESLDIENPDVDLFVKQLKAGSLAVNEETGTVLMPHFTSEDIDALLDHADDLAEIPSFPLAPVSYGGKPRLGECILWLVESIRLEQNASLGYHLVHKDAVNYEGIYFLNDDEVLDAVAHYRRWWKTANHTEALSIINSSDTEPLTGSNYMWW